MAIMIISPTQAVSVPKGCTEVAIYGKNWMVDGKPIDIKQLVNFIDCIKELYKIYKTTDWKKIHSMIPQEVRDVILKVPNLGKNAVAVAQREGLCFVAVYLLHRAVDLYNRTMSLNIDYKMYQNKFEWLQMELRPLIDLIHNELLPQWEYLNTAALRKITTEVIEKLSRYQAELKQLVRVIHNDIKKGLSGRRWAAGFTLGSFVFSVASMIVGNVPGAISASTAGVTSLVNVGSLTATINKLESLQYDVEMMCNETEEYRSLLEQRSMQGMLLESFHSFILLSFVFMSVWFQPIRGEHDLEGEEQDGRIRDEHDL